MIIKKCDVCNKEVNNLNTIILYKKSIDYCNECKIIVEQMVSDFQKDVDFENVMMDNSLRKKEKKYLKKIKVDKKK